MRMFSSLAIAFSMYSKIPMPQVNWSKENMKYAICFFPLIGAVIGALCYLWCLFGNRMVPGNSLHTVILLLIPVIVTGGIHLDGLLDTADAINSYKPMEQKLEILKDSNSGAFAVITCCVYFFMMYGVYDQITIQTAGVIGCGFVLSRALSGFALVSFPKAKNTGLAATFSDGAVKSTVKITMLTYGAVAACGMLVIDWRQGLACLIGAFLSFGYYHHMSCKTFGGITGDLAGFFLQISELMMALAVVLVHFWIG